MARIVRCPAVECIHNADGGRCAARNLTLAQRNIHTVHEGRLTLFECKAYEQTEEYRQLMQILESLNCNVRGSDQKERMI